MNNPYRPPQSSILLKAKGQIPLATGKYLLLFLLTVLICIVIPILVSTGFAIVQLYSKFSTNPFSFTLNFLQETFTNFAYFAPDIILSLLLYTYTLLTRQSFYKVNQSFNFIHYSIAAILCHLMSVPVLYYMIKWPILASMKTHLLFHITIGISCGVLVCWVWQAAFNRARRGQAESGQR